MGECKHGAMISSLSTNGNPTTNEPIKGDQLLNVEGVASKRDGAKLLAVRLLVLPTKS